MVKQHCSQVLQFERLWINFKENTVLKFQSDQCPYIFQIKIHDVQRTLLFPRKFLYQIMMFLEAKPEFITSNQFIGLSIKCRVSVNVLLCITWAIENNFSSFPWIKFIHIHKWKEKKNCFRLLVHRLDFQKNSKTGSSYVIDVEAKRNWFNEHYFFKAHALTT